MFTREYIGPMGKCLVLCCCGHHEAWASTSGARAAASEKPPMCRNRGIATLRLVQPVGTWKDLFPETRMSLGRGSQSSVDQLLQRLPRRHNLKVQTVKKTRLPRRYAHLKVQPTKSHAKRACRKGSSRLSSVTSQDQARFASSCGPRLGFFWGQTTVGLQEALSSFARLEQVGTASFFQFFFRFLVGERFQPKKSKRALLKNLVL